MKKKYVLALSLLSSPSFAGFYVLTPQNSPLNTTTPTHVVVAGYSKGDGDSFLWATGSRARMLQTFFKDNQVLVIVPANNNSSRGFFGWNKVRTEAEVMQKMGFRLIDSSSAYLNGESLVNYVDRFQKLASLDVYSHSTVHSGAGLQDGSARLSQNTTNLSKLKDNFIVGAFAQIHGCNSGFKAAPGLSKAWGIPVLGSLTATNFSELHVDGNWYRNIDGAYPRVGGDPWVGTNRKSFPFAQPCYQGGCTRMHPINGIYDGTWGRFSGGGLSFYKAFCSGITRENCVKGMANNIIAYPSVNPISFQNKDSFRNAVIDQLCPINPGMDRAGARGCRAALLESETTQNEIYNGFNGNALECSFETCNFQWSCQKDRSGQPIQGTCGLSAPTNNAPKTLIQEYKAYLEGFDLLKGQP